MLKLTILFYVTLNLDLLLAKKIYA